MQVIPARRTGSKVLSNVNASFCRLRSGVTLGQAVGAPAFFEVAVVMLQAAEPGKGLHLFCGKNYTRRSARFANDQCC
jgi:hypothetical protein